MRLWPQTGWAPKRPLKPSVYALNPIPVNVGRTKRLLSPLKTCNRYASVGFGGPMKNRVYGSVGIKEEERYHNLRKCNSAPVRT